MQGTRLLYLNAILGTAIIALTSCGGSYDQESQVNDTVIKSDSRNVYFITPWKDTFREDKVTALNDGIEALRNILSKNQSITNITSDPLERLRFSSQELGPHLDQIEGFMNQGARSIEDLGLSMVDVVPSAFMIVVGGGLTAKMKLGVGGGGLLAFVIMPAKVVTVNQATRKSTEQWKFLISVSAIAHGDVGAGVKAGGSFKAGIGFIWGDLNHPREFRGLAAGVSHSIDLFGGTDIKIMALKRSSESLISNFFAITTVGAGLGAGAEITWTGSAVLGMDSVVESIFGGAEPLAGPLRAGQKSDTYANR